MKPLTRFVVTLGVSTGAAGGCNDLTQPERLPTPVEILNTAPTAFAGPDLSVPLPSGAVLSGIGTDLESSIASYSWRKSSGPDSYSIESPSSSRTTVTKLEKGRYEFELTVTDHGGLTGKDTVGVFVYDPRIPGANELVFKKVKWQCPMGCSLSIETFRDYVPEGTAVRVFLISGVDTEWVEAKLEKEWTVGVKYVYGFYEKRLWVYSDHEYHEADVKVTF